MVDTAHHAKLAEFMEHAALVDYVELACVYDLRPLSMTLHQLCSKIGAQAPKVHQGFATLAPAKTAEVSRLLSLCGQRGVIKHSALCRRQC